MTAEPRWLTRKVVDAVHDAEVRRNGGLPGVRDDGAIESALARARQKWAYGEPDLADLAAAYGFGLGVASGELDEAALAVWIRRSVRPREGTPAG